MIGEIFSHLNVWINSPNLNKVLDFSYWNLSLRSILNYFCSMNPN